MSSEAPAQPPTGIHALPKEVARHIIVLVAAQDRAIRASDISLASAPSMMGPGTARGMLPEGRWSFWYAHGVSALSLVDKRFRELATPFLCETVKAVQLSKPIFQFGRIPLALLAGITSLGLVGATADTFAAAAWALKDLPNLRRIELFDDLMQNVEADDFDVRGASMGPIVGSAANLKNLELDAQGSLFGMDSCWSTLAVLQVLERIEQLALTGSAFKFEELLTCPTWQDAVSLRSLRSLTVQAEDVAVFAFVQRIAPNIKHLDINFFSSLSFPDEGYTAVSLPSLVSLRIAGPPLCGAVLSCVDLSHLTSLLLVIDESTTGNMNCNKLVAEDVSLPAGLDFHLSTHRLIQLHDVDALQARCDEAGVVFTSARHSLMAAFSPPSRDTVEPSMSVPRKDAVIEALQWAEARVVECLGKGDMAGVQEMAEALCKVAERKLIETL
ncbi:hypothetical protein JCM3770_005018 [Rhodotorula araucariae]